MQQLKVQFRNGQPQRLRITPIQCQNCKLWHPADPRDIAHRDTGFCEKYDDATYSTETC